MRLRPVDHRTDESARSQLRFYQRFFLPNNVAPKQRKTRAEGGYHYEVGLFSTRQTRVPKCTIMKKECAFRLVVSPCYKELVRFWVVNDCTWRTQIVPHLVGVGPKPNGTEALAWNYLKRKSCHVI